MSCYKDAFLVTAHEIQHTNRFSCVTRSVWLLVTAHEFQHTKILIFHHRFSCVMMSGLKFFSIPDPDLEFL